MARNERAQSAALETLGKVESPYQVPEFAELPVVLIKFSNIQIIVNGLLLLNSTFDDSHPNHDLGVSDTMLSYLQ